LIARTLSDTGARANFAPGVARHDDRNIVPFGRLCIGLDLSKTALHFFVTSKVA
jgi:hypothetical protein